MMMMVVTMRMNCDIDKYLRGNGDITVTVTMMIIAMRMLLIFYGSARNVQQHAPAVYFLVSSIVVCNSSQQFQVR